MRVLSQASSPPGAGRHPDGGHSAGGNALSPRPPALHTDGGQALTPEARAALVAVLVQTALDELEAREGFVAGESSRSGLSPLRPCREPSPPSEVT
jgi:hypothetical protein